MNNSWPKECESGLIQTKNAMGVMTTELSPVALKFIDAAKTATKPMLDIGSAYGVATHPALRNGANVIACDISDAHLDILAKTAPSETLDRLILDNSSFPDQTNYEQGSLSHILISLVLHFLNGDLIEDGLKKCYDWLEPGGKISIVVMTPDLSFYKKAWPEYHRNVRQGKKWPGIFDTKDLVLDIFIDSLPSIVHLFDEYVLVRAVQDAGFSVSDMNYFCYNNFPRQHRNNGKEFIGVIGVK